MGKRAALYRQALGLTDVDEDRFNKLLLHGGRLVISGALDPILWLCVIVTLPTLVVVVVNPDVPMWLVILGCAPVLVALGSFMYLLVVNRDKLLREEWRVNKVLREDNLVDKGEKRDTE